MFLFYAAPASAAVVTDRPLLFSFDGSDTTAGKFSNVSAVEIDQASGVVYVIDGGKTVLDKFNTAGVAQTFSATGSSSLVPGEGIGGLSEFADVAIDNYGTNPGRIYLHNPNQALKAFSVAGSELWMLRFPGSSGSCGVAVDATGHPWFTEFPNAGIVEQLANTGSPPAEVGSFSTGSNRYCLLDVDSGGNAYLNHGEGGVDKYVGGSKTATIDAERSQGVTVDQSSSTGHVFTVHLESHNGSFDEYDSAGALIGSYAVNVVGQGAGIAYDSALDRVYLSDAKSDTVKVFGSEITDTVPDPTIEASEASITKAKFKGKVNPQSVPNRYFFEWKAGTGEGWSQAKTSPPQTLPEDSSDHQVEFSAAGLFGNTTYQVRLVVENTEKGLRLESSPDTFTTSSAAAPTVTIGDPSPVTSTAAAVSGTINPQEDFNTTWLLRLSTDPACTSGFVDRSLHQLESEASSPVVVSGELTGLLPSQHYCVRISATNSGGTVTSETKEFETDPVIPVDAFTAFASPRLDTSARLNGRVNPEGANAVQSLTYRFEYSKDGGSTWIALPDLEYSGEARKQIVLSQELTGLTPGTTYSYRFSAENDAGEVSPQGAVKTFTTRSAAELAAPGRGIELVNNPDKGNQNAFSEIGNNTTAAPTMSASGERVLWRVVSGTPGGSASSYNVFLAERSPSGWHSRNLIPPATQQVENANLPYFVVKATPDFSHFLVDVGGGVGSVSRSIVRIDREQHQDVLGSYANSVRGERGEISDDGAHALIINPDNRQLEDLDGATPELVSVMPDGSPSCGLDHEGASFAGGSVSGAGANWVPGYRLMEVEDASRVYFEVACTPSDPYALYERNREAEETTLIDPGTVGFGSVEFIRATPDGRHAYFTTASKLDPADGNNTRDVYRWDEEAGESSCLTCVVANADVLRGPSTAVMVSDDFSHVYFQSEAQLVPGLGEQGEDNAYSLSDGEIHFVAAGISRWRDFARLSADGNVLAFVSESQGERLTTDRLPAKCSQIGGVPALCRELYRYEDRDGSVECISCRRGGETTFGVFLFSAGSGDFWVSGDGSTIAFSTPEALVPLDVNKTVDAYEWRSGAVRLVTDGVREFSQGFTLPRVRGLSEDGTSILFNAGAPGLTGFEQDGLVNLYVARIGGGFEPPAPQVHCSEESCQGPLQVPPAQQAPSSSSFSGHGNAKEGQGKPRCSKGKVHRRGRCVKRPHKKHHKRASHAKQGRTK